MNNIRNKFELEAEMISPTEITNNSPFLGKGVDHRSIKLVAHKCNIDYDKIEKCSLVE